MHQKFFAVQAGICRQQDLVGAGLELGSPSCGCRLLMPLRNSNLQIPLAGERDLLTSYPHAARKNAPIRKAQHIHRNATNCNNYNCRLRREKNTLLKEQKLFVKIISSCL